MKKTPGVDLALNEDLTIRRDHIDLGLIGITIVAWIVLLSPWTDLRAIVAPWFVFLLPGCAAIVLLRRELKSPVEFIALSFLISVSFVFTSRVILARLSVALPSYLLIFVIAAWTLTILLTRYVRDATHDPPRSITVVRSDLYLILILILVYIGMSIFVLRAKYTPTPDELAYMLNAREFNLAGTIPVVDPAKAWLVNFVLTRPLWFISLASYLLASADSPFSSQLLSVFFFVMLVLATYRVGKGILGGEVGLIAAILLAVSPSLLIWGSTVLLDLPLAVFLILGYGYFLHATQLKNGKLERISVGSLVLAIVCFLLSSLLKLGDPVLPALVYLYFVYLVWKSELPSKRLVLLVLLALPALYLTFDGLYNIFTYVVPNTALHNLIRPFLPVSFFERFFALFYQGSVYKPVAAISLWGILQGIYLAGLAPFLITYPVLFASIAGVIKMVGSKGSSTRGHGVFSLLVVGLASLLSALFLYSYDIPRNVIYIYPFIIVAAAVGISFSLRKGLTAFVLSAMWMVAVIYEIESSMLGIGIGLGAIPAPDRYTLSLLSLNFVLGVVIVAWKVLESIIVGHTSSTTQRRRSISWVSAARMAAIGVVCLLCLSQFVVFVQTSPYRSTSNFTGLTPWLDSHVHAGDVIFTNGREALMSLANDTTLKSFKDGAVSMLPIPSNSTALVRLTGSSASAFLIVFKQAQYTDTDSYTPGQFFMQSKQWSTTVASGPDYQVYDLSLRAAATLSILNISTVDSEGAQITGYYVTLLQNGTQFDNCFSPCSFTVISGQTYQVATSSYGTEVFSHWKNDGSIGFETVNVAGTNGTISLVAVYNP